MKKNILLLLFLPMLVFGQTIIHRSIQNNANAIWTSGGTITLTIVDTIATFSADAPDSVGRGNLIQYDSTGSSTFKAGAYIKYRISKRQFGVQRFQGSAPATASATTKWNIYHPYRTWDDLWLPTKNASLTIATGDLHSQGVNLEGRNESWHVAFYAGAQISWSSGGNNFNTSATCVLYLYAPCGTKYVGVSQRHSGKLTYRGPVFNGNNQSGWMTDDDAGGRNCQDLIIDGLQWDITGTGARDCLTIHASQSGAVHNFTIKNNIFHGSDSVATTAISHYAIAWNSGTANSAGRVAIYNNLIYGFKTTAATTNEGGILFIVVANIADSMLVHSNTIYRCQDGIKRTTPGNILRVKNTIVQKCGDGFNGGIGGSFNVSDIASDCGSCTDMITGTVSFTNPSAGDFTLQSGDTVAKNAGTQTAMGSLVAPTTDIKGYTRPVSQNDVGAFEQGATDNGCSTQTDAVSSSPGVIPVKSLQRLRRMW